MALIDAECAKLGNQVEVQIRKKSYPGTIVKKHSIKNIIRNKNIAHYTAIFYKIKT